MIVDGIYALVAYILAEEEALVRFRRNWWVFMVLPAFRWVVFWFRFSGFLTVLKDPPQWRVEDPVQQTIDGLQRAKITTVVLLTHLSKVQLRLLMVELVRILRG
jgi:hypothetical protein